jgi:two-component system chemotaxis sensor kinase CheA
MDRREELKRQLMVTFQAELEDHLGTLNRDLLALEEGPPQEEWEPLLADLFRAAHSLKGAARAVDLQDIETIAHRLEDVLSAIQRRDLSPPPELFDVLFRAVDSLREAMAAYLRGETLPAEQRDQLLARLEAAVRGETETFGDAVTRRRGDAETQRQGDKEMEITASPRHPLTPSPPHPVSESSSLPITPSPPEETIRVATAKLDALMDGMGELLVARMRTEQRLAELQTLQQQLTRWQKCWRQVRSHYHLRFPISDWSFDHRPSDIAPLLDFLAHNEEHLRALSAEIDGLLCRFASDYSRLTLLTGDLQDGVRCMRMLPIATLFDLFPRMVRDLARERGKEVTLRVVGADTEVDRQVLEAMKDPLTHLLRNAMDHGIETPDDREAVGKPRRGTIHLRAAQKGNTIVLEVADDGAGIDLPAVRGAAVERGLLTAQEVASLSDQEAMQFIFRSGLSTLPEVTSLSGRGVGLDVVRENLEGLHGLIEVDTALGQGTTFTMTLPLTLATSRVLLVEVAGQMVAVPAMTVERILRVEASAVGRIEGRPAIRADGRPLPLVSLAQVLELPEVEAPLAPGQRIPVVVLGVVEKRIAFRVDGFRGTQEVVIKNLGPQLSRVRNVAGVTILGSGEVVMILNVADLMKTAQVGPAMAAPLPVEVREVRRRRVLVVDDSITTRTLEKNILESAGYEVLVAADGEEAWALVQSEPLDAVAADIAMPRLDGFVLTEKVKSDERFKELPVVLVTSLESPQDKIRGLEAGADAYITKSTFDQLELLETIERLIG